MEILEKENVLFMITKEDVQAEAIARIGRELDEWELVIVKDCLYEGLMFDIGTVYRVALQGEIPRLSEHLQKNGNSL